MKIELPELRGLPAHARRYWKAYASVVAVLALILIGIVIVNRPEGAVIEKHEQKADQLEDQSLKHEGRADAAGEQADTIDVQRREADRRLTTNKAQAAKGRERLNERKREYDEAKSGSTVNGASGDLNERERRVLSKLQALYPGAAFIIQRTTRPDN